MARFDSSVIIHFSCRRMMILLTEWLLLLFLLLLFCWDEPRMMCHALSSPSSLVYLAKTKETFKLSDLQYLTANIEAQQRHPWYNVTRVVVDPATGSSIFRLDVAYNHPMEDNISRKNAQSINDFVVTSSPSSSFWPSSWTQYEWIAEVLVMGNSAVELLEHLKNNDQHPLYTPIAKGWTLEYRSILMGGRGRRGVSAKQERKNHHRPSSPSIFTSKTLLYSVAHALSTPPALNPAHATDRLIVLEIPSIYPTTTTTTTTTAIVSTTNTTDENAKTVVDPADTTFYLTRVVNSEMTPPPVSTQSRIEIQWSNRPFQYSSAINMNVAEIVIDTLMDMVVQDRQREQTNNNNEDRDHNQRNNNHNNDYHKDNCTSSIRLLDPTCGSGTFLAFAMSKGMKVVGFDINPKCVHGTLKNLQHLFGPDIVSRDATIRHQDSSSSSNILPLSSLTMNRTSKSSQANGNSKEPSCERIDCVVANLPWGVNSIEYQDENLRILQSVRKRLEYKGGGKDVGIPCAVVTKGSDPSLFQAARFEVLGEAYIPPRDFDLPTGNKKRLSSESGPALPDGSNPRNFRNNCVVSILRTV